ncbi:hypothetical protein D3C78_1597450 [compost metagenome]
MSAEVIHNTDFTEQMFEGADAAVGQTTLLSLAVESCQLQRAADLLLALNQGRVFRPQRRPILLREEAQPILCAFANGVHRFGWCDECQM